VNGTKEVSEEKRKTGAKFRSRLDDDKPSSRVERERYTHGEELRRGLWRAASLLVIRYCNH
jgi:hypothetical protein